MSFVAFFVDTVYGILINTNCPIAKYIDRNVYFLFIVLVREMFIIACSIILNSQLS